MSPGNRRDPLADPQGRPSVEIEGRRLRLSNLDKVLYPEAGFTKAQVIDYYARIGAVDGPPPRRPAGDDGPLARRGRRPVVLREALPVARPRRGCAPPPCRTTSSQCVIDDLPSLVWVANMAALELHTPQAAGSSPDRPDSMVFDLDPGPGATILDCCRVGLDLRGLLDELGLESVVKTSGSKGLHLAVPLHTDATDDHTKEFARAVGQLLAKRDPKRVTVIMKKEQRTGQGVRRLEPERPSTRRPCARTRCAARPAPDGLDAGVWDEVSDALDAGTPTRSTFEAADVLERVEELGDLYAAEPGARAGAARARQTAHGAPMKLDGKVAIVTGASRGVGAATAVALAAEGATVACAARATDADPLPLPGTIDDTVRRITDAGGDAPRRADQPRPRGGRRADGRHDRRALRPARHPREQRRDHVSRRPRPAT